MTWTDRENPWIRAALLICQGPRRQSVIVHQPWQIGTGGDIFWALSPSPPQHHSETGSRTSSHAPPFLITRYKRCLKPSCLATKCFGAVLYFGFAVSLTPLPATPAHSYTLEYLRNCITEMCSIAQTDHRNTSLFCFLLVFFVICSALQSVFWIPLTSFLLLLQFLYLLDQISF